MDYSGKIIRKNPVTPSQTSASGVWTLDEALQAQRSNTWPVANVPDPMSRSLRFRSSAEANLSRTPSNTATSGTTWTVSYWFKVNVGSTASRRCGFSAGNADATGGSIQFLVTWEGYSQNYKMCIVTGQGVTSITTSGVFRDPSAWYHVVVACDTTQATASNRWKIFVNGVQQAIGGDAFGGSANYPTQNTTFRWNASGQANLIGATDESGTKVSFMDGYIAEFNNIDGQALTPSSFGGTNAVTGVWEPRPYTGTYGTNGFLLTFSDITSTTTLGNDTSGNSNNWTTNNISLTAGSTYDSMLDVPTQWIGYSTGTNEVRGNYAVLNPLKKPTNDSIANANLQFTGGTTGTIGFIPVTQAVSSGKWYFEATLVTSARVFVGIVADTRDTGGNVAASAYADGYDYRLDTGEKRNNNTATAYGASLANGDVLGCAFDLDNGKIWWSKNGVYQASGDPVAGTNAAYTGISGTFQPEVGHDSYAAPVVAMNLGQRPFTYTPPAGFVSLCTTNLPNPTILQGNQFMNTVLYTGNSTARTITGVGFQPDFNWTKPRNAVGSHVLTDSVRGVTKFLETNSTGAEQTGSTGVQSWNSDGYALGTGNDWNITGETFVSWNWRASNAAGVTNTAGSITSTVSANPTSGFSIVTYTGTGVNATVGHGLGVAPSWIVAKVRNASGESWGMYHVGLTSATNAIYLNLTQGQESAATQWNSTAPTSSVFSIGTNARINGNTNTFVAYCFAAVAGYSAFGRYTGTGSSDGAFVYTGFRPRYVMFMRTDTTGGAAMVDSARDPFNVAGQMLYPYGTDAEGTNPYCDLVSNGFKVRGTSLFMNANGGTYIYMAFAETPFKNALAR